MSKVLHSTVIVRTYLVGKLLDKLSFYNGFKSSAVATTYGNCISKRTQNMNLSCERSPIIVKKYDDNSKLKMFQSQMKFVRITSAKFIFSKI